MNIAYRINPADYSVALSLRDASPVYYRMVEAGVMHVIDPATAEDEVIPATIFQRRYVPRPLCPEALRKKADAVPDYREWRKQQEAKGRKYPDEVREEMP